MSDLLLFSSVNSFWLLLPLVIAMSLVYNASRYESPSVILRRSARYCVNILIFMAVVLLFLYVVQP